MKKGRGWPICKKIVFQIKLLLVSSKISDPVLLLPNAHHRPRLVLHHLKNQIRTKSVLQKTASTNLKAKRSLSGLFSLESTAPFYLRA